MLDSPRFGGVKRMSLAQSGVAQQLEFPLHSTKTSVDVRSILRATAAPFIKKWHYSGKVPTGQNIFFGCYVNGELFAVASYGKGAEMKDSGAKYLAEVTGLAVTTDNLVSLKRLCRVGSKNDKGAVPLTQFLAHCHRLLKRDHGIRFIVSFSDPEHNAFDKKNGDGIQYDSGGIYKAANFKYLGKTSAVYHCIDQAGNIVHRRKAYRLKERVNEDRYGPKKDLPAHHVIDPITHWPVGAMTIDDARKQLGLTPIRTTPKDRWFIDLGELKKR